MANPRNSKLGAWANTASPTTSWNTGAGDTLPVAGNPVLALVRDFGTHDAITAVADNQGNVYAPLTDAVTAPFDGELRPFLCPAIGPVSNPFTVEAALTGSFQSRVDLLELEPGWVLDQIGVLSSQTGAATLSVTASAPNAAAGDWVLAAFGTTFSGANPALALPSGSPYTLLLNDLFSGSIATLYAWATDPTTGPSVAQAQEGNPVGFWGGYVLTFKGGAPPPPGAGRLEKMGLGLSLMKYGTRP